MADKKISELDAITSSTSDAVFPLTNDPGVTPITKKITYANLRAAMNASPTFTGTVTLPANVISPSSHQVSEEGLVLGMNFNTENITGTAGAETVLDSSVYNNHGTNNGATHDPDGGFNGGGAFSFDGTNDTIETRLINSVLGNNFTISFWAYLSNNDDNYRNIIKTAGWNGAGNFIIYYRLTVLSFDIKNDSGTIFSIPYTSFSKYNQWVNITVKADSDNYVRMYIDGEYYNQTSFTGSLNTAVNKAISIGSSDTGLSGSLDNVKIYNRALSADEIKAQYLQRAEVKDSYVSQKDVFVDSSGNVGIGTINPTERLEVAGDIKAETVISPILIGGKEEGDKIIYKSTLGIGGTTAHTWRGGNNAQYACSTSETGWQRCADDSGTNNGGTYGVGKSLKAVGVGSGVGAGNDLVGFAAKLPGYRDTGGAYGSLGSYLYLWSSTESSSTGAWGRVIGSTYSAVFRNAYSKGYGFSIRCLRDTDDTSDFTDPRDDTVYQCVRIGTQVWMTKNLAYLPSVNEALDNSTDDPMYYVYGYDGTDVATAKALDTYINGGVLYNYPAAIISAPTGFHVPSDEELNVLELATLEIIAETAGDDLMTILNDGNVGIGTTSPTALLHLAAGTATNPPLKLTTGTLLTTPEAGAIEFLDDAYYGAITTAGERKEFAFSEDVLKLDQTTPQTITAGQPIQDILTASELVATDADKKLSSLPVATYPSLAELIHVKGVTSAIQTQINLKSPLASPTFTGTVTGITKAMVGLGNVDNTSDATKNSATATLTNKTITAPVISTISNTGTLTLPTATGTVALTSDITGTNSNTNTGDEVVATGAEIDTGTNDVKYASPKAIHDSQGNIRWLLFNLVEAGTDCATATNIAGDFVSPIAGTILQSDTTPFYIYATNSTAGVTGTMVVDISINDTSIMTTNKLDIDTTEKTSTTGATPPDLTTTALAVGDIITIDIDAVHSGTAAKGLTVYIAVRE